MWSASGGATPRRRSARMRVRPDGAGLWSAPSPACACWASAATWSSGRPARARQEGGGRLTALGSRRCGRFVLRGRRR
eukprot:11181004-Lingulodinium_polyedra.AAC.1